MNDGFNHFPNGERISRTDIKHPERSIATFQSEDTGIDKIADIQKVPSRGIVLHNDLRPLTRLSDNCRYQKILRLAVSIQIEWPQDNAVDSHFRRIKTAEFFGEPLGMRIGVIGDDRVSLINRQILRRAIQIRTDEDVASPNGPTKVENMLGTEGVNPVEFSSVTPTVGYKGQTGAVDDRVNAFVNEMPKGVGVSNIVASRKGKRVDGMPRAHESRCQSLADKTGSAGYKDRTESRRKWLLSFQYSASC